MAGRGEPTGDSWGCRVLTICSVVLMMRYGLADLKVERYTAKISMSNEPSIALFKKLGFEVCAGLACFQANADLCRW